MKPFGWLLVILGYLFAGWLYIDLWQSTGSTPVHPELTVEQKQRVKAAVKKHGNFTIIREGNQFTLIRGKERVQL
jgi:hypothetical protein